MPSCSKICSLNKLTSFSSSEIVLLSLNKAFSHCFSTPKWAKRINFEEMMIVVQVLVMQVQIFKDTHF